MKKKKLNALPDAIDLIMEHLSERAEYLENEAESYSNDAADIRNQMEILTQIMDDI